jgi:predicted secreted protein
MRTLAALAVGAALAAGAAGCGGGSTTYVNPHGTIGVKRGDEFTLQFKVNASIGFDWQVIPFGLELPKVELLKTQTSYPDDHRAGESGTRRYRFRATKVGRQVLIFQHFFRSQPQERRVLRIDVKPAS